MSVGSGYNTLPVDKGWAWAIAAAGFISHVLMGGSGQTNSVLFVEILKKYETNITTGSLLFMCATLSFSVGSVAVANVLLPKFGERRCMFVGGILCCAFTMCASFAPNIGLFITFIAMKGFSHGFVFVTAISLIPHYFDKLRSRASILPWCGGSTASIIGPFVIRAIRKEYGISGAYFLLSAMELNYCFAAMLLRPVSAYGSHSGKPATSLDTSNESTSACAVTVGSMSSLQEETSSMENSSQVQSTHEENSEDNRDVREALLTSKEHTDMTDATVEEQPVTKARQRTDITKDRSNVYYRQNTYVGSVLTLNSEIEVPLELMVEDVTDDAADKGLTKWQKLYQGASLDLWSFRWTMLSLLPGTVNSFLISYLPTISNSRGASLDQAAMLVTIMGSVEIVSRVCAGFIADTHILPPSTLLVISQVCMGVLCHVLRLATSFTSLIPIIILTGIFVGSRGPLIPLLCIEVVGVKRLPQAYSLVCLLNTLAIASFNPILGSVVEAYGSFIPVLHIMGSCYVLCSGLIFLIPLFSRLDIKHGRKQ